MLADVQTHFGLTRPFDRAGNFETEHQTALVREVCATVQTGRLVVVSGLVGSGKTHLLRRIEDQLARAGKVSVAKSLAVDKQRTSLPSLIEALFYDLSPGDRAQVKIPKQPERRERELRDLMKKAKRPIVLIVDEAHDLHAKTLTGLKRLMEVVADAGVLLSVLLVGHIKLRNDLRRPKMEEIGYRTTTFEFEGVGPHRREYIAWLLKECSDDDVKVGSLMDADAIDLMAERLRTPLQIEMHLTLAFEHAFRLGAKPVSVEVVEDILSRAINDLEPTLIRNGYDAATLAAQFNAKPIEIKAFFAGTLAGDRTQELTDQMRAAGVPI
jgi:type II secretory pathway predicted ATPase ExeA